MGGAKRARLMTPHHLILLIGMLLFAATPLSAKTIRVKVVVDEEEAMAEGKWQRRLQTRVQRASQVIHAYCDVKFGVVTFERWNSDNRINDLNRSLREFETEIPLGRTELVIGFTSQYVFRRGHNTLGGTRGPLHTHILIREGAPTLNEVERIEAVVHELGHYLGAVHSSDPLSVMRPTLGAVTDGKIGFDRENARVIRLVASDMIDLRAKRFHQLSTDTKKQLRQHYQRLAQQLPQDDSASRYLQFVERALQFAPAGAQPLLPARR